MTDDATDHGPFPSDREHRASTMNAMLCVEWRCRDASGARVHGGWCAVTERDPAAVSTRTLCGHAVFFPGRYEERKPTCDECITRLRDAAPDASTTRSAAK